MINFRFSSKNMVLASVLAASPMIADVALAEATQKRHPVNCATAEGDLRAIAAEKKHAQDQQVESVISILPAGALLGFGHWYRKQKIVDVVR